MAKPIRVVIGGNDYTLRGEDEKVIQYAAEEVNKQLDELKTAYKGESGLTLTVLAALNIAEKHYMIKNETGADEREIAKELDSMADFLMKNTI